MPVVDGVPALQFKKVEGYTTFWAEYAFDGEDIVFHFFLPPEKANEVRSAYWLTAFPAALEVAGPKAFQVGAPRLQGKHINDLGINSWWFRAFGFAEGLAPDALAERFFDALDQELDTSSHKPG